MAKTHVRVHYDGGTVDLEISATALPAMRSVATEGFWKSEKIYYPPNRIVYLELLKEVE